ncbi:CS-domain-containing protein, partial [Conidiobolus coronatus NRRL 28638]
KEPEPEVILEDPENLKVDVGTPCKRQSCKHAYVSDEVSRKGGSDSECTYHSGKPVFHEGSKGWSCCKRKVLEFDEFLKIKGCKKGNHLFGEQLSIVDCRKDWYQTATQVILSIFAKNTEKESCKISFTSHAVIVDLKFQNGKSLYQKTIDLFQEITPEESSYKVMGTKVELTLKKANGISWPSLEPT